MKKNSENLIKIIKGQVITLKTSDQLFHESNN